MSGDDGAVDPRTVDATAARTNRVGQSQEVDAAAIFLGVSVLAAWGLWAFGYDSLPGGLLVRSCLAVVIMGLFESVWFSPLRLLSTPAPGVGEVQLIGQQAPKLTGRGRLLMLAGWTPDRPLPEAFRPPRSKFAAVLLVAVAITAIATDRSLFPVCLAGGAVSAVITGIETATLTRRWLLRDGLLLGLYFAAILSFSCVSIWPLALAAAGLVPVVVRQLRRAEWDWWTAERDSLCRPLQTTGPAFGDGSHLDASEVAIEPASHVSPTSRVSIAAGLTCGLLALWFGVVVMAVFDSELPDAGDWAAAVQQVDAAEHSGPIVAAVVGIAGVVLVLIANPQPLRWRMRGRTAARDLAELALSVGWIPVASLPVLLPTPAVRLVLPWAFFVYAAVTSWVICTPREAAVLPVETTKRTRTASRWAARFARSQWQVAVSLVLCLAFAATMIAAALDETFADFSSEPMQSMFVLAGLLPLIILLPRLAELFGRRSLVSLSQRHVLAQSAAVGGVDHAVGLLGPLRLSGRVWPMGLVIAAGLLPRFPTAAAGTLAVTSLLYLIKATRIWAAGLVTARERLAIRLVTLATIGLVAGLLVLRASAVLLGLVIVSGPVLVAMRRRIAGWAIRNQIAREVAPPDWRLRRFELLLQTRLSGDRGWAWQIDLIRPRDPAVVWSSSALLFAMPAALAVVLSMLDPKGLGHPQTTVTIHSISVLLLAGSAAAFLQDHPRQVDPLRPWDQTGRPWWQSPALWGIVAIQALAAGLHFTAVSEGWALTVFLVTWAVTVLLVGWADDQQNAKHRRIAALSDRIDAAYRPRGWTASGDHR